MIRNRVLFAAFALAFLLLASPAFAQEAPAASIQMIFGDALMTVLSLVITAFLAWLRSHMKDTAAATALDAALKNALGAMQQTNSSASGARLLDASIMDVPGLSPAMREGMQYVLNHAGAEMDRFGITPAAIAEKLSARVGGLNIQTNIATAASPDPSPKPLDPVLRPMPIAR